VSLPSHGRHPPILRVFVFATHAIVAGFQALGKFRHWQIREQARSYFDCARNPTCLYGTLDLL